MQNPSNNTKRNANLVNNNNSTSSKRQRIAPISCCKELSTILSKIAKAKLSSDLASIKIDFETWLIVNNHPTLIGKKFYLMSQTMSGDSRLIGLWCSYNKIPLIYVKSPIDNNSSTLNYLETLDVTVLQAVDKDYHEIFKSSQNNATKFNFNYLQIFPATQVTQHVAEYLENHSDEFIKFVTTKAFLSFDDKNNINAPNMPGISDILKILNEIFKKEKPIVLLWTKQIDENVYNSKPQHLIGHTGISDILNILSKDTLFSVALCGSKTKNNKNVKWLGCYDFDLRHVEDGKLITLSLHEQYTFFNILSQFLPVLSIGMRSGNMEPLPLLSINTLYLEEKTNSQTFRLDSYATALSKISGVKIFKKIEFTLPPTLKGQLGEAIEFFYHYYYHGLEMKLGTPKKILDDILIKIFSIKCPIHKNEFENAVRTQSFLSKPLKEKLKASILEFDGKKNPFTGDLNFKNTYKTLIDKNLPVNSVTKRGFSSKDINIFENEIRTAKSALKRINSSKLRDIIQIIDNLK